MKWMVRLGELLFALLMLYSGVMHFKFAGFVAGLVPQWLPWHLFWAYFTGTALFATGISIVVQKKTRLAALLSGVMLFLFVILIHGPSMIHSILQKPQDVSVLWSFNGTGGANNALKDIGLTLSAFLLASSQATEGTPSAKRIAKTLAALFAITMAVFGIEHFFYTNYTPGIPSCSFVSFWIPWQLFWGYLTGAALLIGGTMMLIQIRPRAAGIALGVMILAVAVLTYLFRLEAHLGSYAELTNTIKDVALAGGALILAGSLPSEKHSA
jgi:uncharacterized membrane protein